MSNALTRFRATADVTPEPKPSRKRKPLVVASIVVMNPKNYNRLALATERGMKLAAAFVNGRLVVTEERA